MKHSGRAWPSGTRTAQVGITALLVTGRALSGVPVMAAEQPVTAEQLSTRR